MKVHKITTVVTLTIQADPGDYEGYETDEERLACDLENFRDCPESMLENEDCRIVVTGEVIELE